MTRRARLSKYSRRTSSGGRSGGRVFIIILSVIAFLLLSVTVSVAVGLALGNRAQEYEDSLPLLDISVKDRYSGGKTVKSVDAQSFELGLDPSYYISIGIKDLSICLRDSDGFITYHSKVDVFFGEDTKMGSRDLSVEVESIRKKGGYVCAYIYSDAMSEDDGYLREIKKSYELALIREAAESGVDDILMVGLEIDSENLVEAEDFVNRASIAAKDAAFGVLLSVDSFKQDGGEGKNAKRISAVCDYVAIDLRAMPSSADEVKGGDEKPELYMTLEELEYFVKVYSARIVFGKDNSGLCNSARKWGVTNMQVIE